MKQRVIYVHPKGRFKIVERLVINPLGEKHWIRETVSLPPDPSCYITRADWSRTYRLQQAIREDERPDIVQMYRQGYSYKEIGVKTGLSYKRVESLLHFRGTRREGDPLSTEEKELISQFREKGISYKSIAKRLNRPLDMVEEYIRGVATS